MLRVRPAQDRVWRIVRTVALRYRDGRDPGHDRPAHVRSASALAWWGERLAAVSDDASFIAVVDPLTGLSDAIALPAGPDGRRQFDRRRGNKADKLDLEACFTLDGALVALGSDSGLAIRRQAAVVDSTGARLVALPGLYAALAQPALGVGVMNLEGAAIHGDALVVGNRGGDQTGGGAPTVDAIAHLPLASVRAALATPDAAVPPARWQPIELGALDGAPLRLTELEPWGDHLAFAATAEATTTAYDDGAVVGSVVGCLDAAPWWARVVDARGAPVTAKLEGLVRWRDRFLATVDADDPDHPSDLFELVLEPWRPTAL